MKNRPLDTVLMELLERHLLLVGEENGYYLHAIGNVYDKEGLHRNRLAQLDVIEKLLVLLQNKYQNNPNMAGLEKRYQDELVRVKRLL